MSGSYWRGTQLRIAEAKPEWDSRCVTFSLLSFFDLDAIVGLRRNQIRIPESYMLQSRRNANGPLRSLHEKVLESMRRICGYLRSIIILQRRSEPLSSLAACARPDKLLSPVLEAHFIASPHSARVHATISPASDARRSGIDHQTASSRTKPS